VPDFRNTRAVDVVSCLQGFGAKVSVWEPMGTPAQIRKYFGLPTLLPARARNLDAIVLVNAHDAFRVLKLADLRRKMRTPVLVDVKNFFDRREAQRLGFRYVSL
jgi:UDP-N-acetyl-D-mannosaminuronate dehydrogenase